MGGVSCEEDRLGRSLSDGGGAGPVVAMLHRRPSQLEESRGQDRPGRARVVWERSPTTRHERRVPSRCPVRSSQPEPDRGQPVQLRAGWTAAHDRHGHDADACSRRATRVAVVLDHGPAVRWDAPTGARLRQREPDGRCVQRRPVAGYGRPDFLGFFLGTFGGNNPAGLLGMSDMQNGTGLSRGRGFYDGLDPTTMIEPVPNRNAMIRATGDILVPVELMDFKIQ